MIRSAPPASASFAERPVPGAGADDRRCRRRPARAAGRAPRRAFTPRRLDQLVQPVGHRRRERRVVDVLAALVHLDRRRRASRAARRAAPRRRRRRGTAGPATAIIETPPSGTKSAVGPVAPESLRPIVRPSSAHSLGRRAHQRHRRVVDVEVAVVELRRHRLARAEVDHVERAERDDLRHARRARGLEPVGPRREHAADELVGELGRRRVEHAREEAVLRERLHRLAARAGGVEDEHLVAELLEPLARGRHARAS